MSVVDDSFNQPLKLEEHAVMSLAGGIVGQGYQCGMLWGAALAAGAESYRRFGAGPQAETGAVLAAQRLVESFRTHNQEINCAEITDLQWKASSQRGFATQVFKFLLKGGPIGCFRMAGSYAPVAYREITSTLAEPPDEVPDSPVSCAALLAQKVGASDRQTAMAAGLAGGIGLSGGACGALGAAIWISGMKDDQSGQSGFTNPAASAVIERFLESADYEFECAKIVGRQFADVHDHAAYLRAGGCTKIIEALATSIVSLPNDIALVQSASGSDS